MIDSAFRICLAGRGKLNSLARTILVTLVATLALADQSLASCPDFRLVPPAIFYHVGLEPSFVTVGDFNGDGTSDIVVANRGSNDVSILLGTGNGRCEPAVNYNAGSWPTSVAVADFNGDGKSDLAVANSGSDNVSILLGDGAGGFAAPVNYGVGSLPLVMERSDLNGDGRSDLVVVNRDSNYVSVLLSAGDGTFTTLNFSVGVMPNSLVIADFNGDGKSDLAVANDDYSIDWYEPVSILLGHGDGTFAPKVDYIAGLNPDSLGSGDFNSDGKIDLVVAYAGYDDMNYVRGLSVLMGNGDGTFGAATEFTGDPAAIQRSVPERVVADFDADGKLDEATIIPDGIEILLGGEHATSFNDADLDLLADFNGDGKNDLAAIDRHHQNIAIFPGQGDGTFASPVTSAVEHIIRSATVGDFNRDAKPDLMMALEAGGEVEVWPGQGDGTFAAGIALPVTYASSIAADDFNGDGIIDVAVARSEQSNVAVLLGNGDGTFAGKASYSTCTSAKLVAVGDFNGDSKADLAIDGKSCGVAILLGNGDGTFAAAIIRGSDGCFEPKALQVGDFNADGRSDLVEVRQPCSGATVVTVLVGHGDGTFADSVNYGTGNDAAVADFNEDGRDDLALFTSGAFDNVSVSLSNADGTFQPANLFSTGAWTVEIAAGDLDGDGKPDLILTPSSFTRMPVLLNACNALEITSIEPAIGTTAGGQSVALVGSNLSDSISVTFGAVAGVIVSNTSTSITANTPAHSAGNVDIVVTTVAGTTVAGIYRYRNLSVGDANGDAIVNAADVFYLISHLFASGLRPIGSGDVNGDGSVNVQDIFYLINYLFAGGQP